MPCTFLGDWFHGLGIGSSTKKGTRDSWSCLQGMGAKREHFTPFCLEMDDAGNGKSFSRAVMVSFSRLIWPHLLSTKALAQPMSYSGIPFICLTSSFCTTESFSCAWLWTTVEQFTCSFSDKCMYSHYIIYVAVALFQFALFWIV